MIESAVTKLFLAGFFGLVTYVAARFAREYWLMPGRSFRQWLAHAGAVAFALYAARGAVLVASEA